MNDIVKKEETAVVEQPEKSMGQMLVEMSKDENMDVGKLQILKDMQFEMEDRQAKRDFNAALVKFKENPPRIIKNMAVSFDKKGGGKTEYKHATIDSVCRQLDKPLNELGLSFRWNVKSDAQKTRVTAILSHVSGYSEESYMEATPDTSGGKNAIQGQGSSVTYLKRYTLLALLGLAEQGEDDDGVKAAMAEQVAPELIEQLEKDMENYGIDKIAYLKRFKIESLANINQAQYGVIAGVVAAKKRTLENENI